MRRALATLLTAAVTLLLLAPVALASNDHGEGIYGETDDVVVTNAGFIVIVFFPLFIAAMSLLQWSLEKRKESRKAAMRMRAERERLRGGW